jgi:tetratricopeptide (TPR) repeat protein
LARGAVSHYGLGPVPGRRARDGGAGPRVSTEAGMTAKRIAIVFAGSLVLYALASATVGAPGALANRGSMFMKEPGAQDTETAAPADMEAGYKAIDAGDYEAAIKVFEGIAAAQPDNAEAFNQLGYIHRRLQDFDQAFAYYKRALEIDPEHTGAHHYIGEAYLEVGNLEMAEWHLAQLDLICLFGCDDYYELEQAVALYKANNTS